MYRVAKIAVDGTAYSFDKAFSYLIPEDREAAPGQRVRVPFGRGNRKRLGIVLECGLSDNREGLKPLLEVLDDQPILDGEGVALLEYLKENTFCTYFDALRLLVPAGLGVVYRTSYTAGNLPPQRLLSNLERELADYVRSRRSPVDGEKLEKRFGPEARLALASLTAQGVLLQGENRLQAVRDERVVMVRRREDWNPQPLTPKQKAVMAFLEENEPASLKEACYYTASTRAVTDALERKGAVEYFDQPVLRNPFGEVEAAAGAIPSLSPGQQAAYDTLAAMLEEEAPRPALLYGVTGSGKTQVYLRLIRRTLEMGRSALVLVPEISLTAQVTEDFHGRFGPRVALLHSALSLGERMDQWKRIRDGAADIVVGTRSAVFAPLGNIGLIVMDEEQEHTYKSEKSPRFHARDIARFRSANHGALLLLASATPAVESYHAAGQGRYRLVELPDRFGPSQLPDVCVVDMADPENTGSFTWLSAVLEEELRRNLDNREQSILLLNRRGYSTLVKCSSCATVAECPHCSVALTFHQANNSLICHYCGYTQGLITACAHCGSELIRYAGAGTQKVAEELASRYPGARILRVDMDTTMTKFSHQRLFKAFSAHEYDIMIGTQMVAKGLNFPDVTLVGVLNADQSLYNGDFRGFERSFSLLTQVVGRGGRGELRGRALIQTYSPENPIIRLAAMQDYPAFYADEIRSRRLHLYPPYCAMAGIGFVGEDLDAVQKACKRFLEKFREVAAERYPQLPVRLLGPVPSDILKAAGKYRYKLVLKCKNSPPTRLLLAEMLAWFDKEGGPMHGFIDMHYDRM